MPKRTKKTLTVNVKTGKAKRAKPKKLEKEVSAVGQALRSLGGLGGRMAGNFLGLGDAGSALGSGLGAAVSRWLGTGDYTVSSNSIISEQLKPTIPAMHNVSQAVVVRHKEFLTEIRGSTAFAIQAQFPINPGMWNTFPWGYRIANCFQEYTIRGMVFHFIPTSGNSVSSTNPALGSVMMQTTYRSNDTTPSNKLEMMNEYWSSEARPSESFCHPIECDPKENPFNVQYVRNGAIPSGDSTLMYDLGLTTIATSGQQTDGGVLGDLWVTYEIELRKPILSSNVTDFTPGSTMTITDAAGSITGSTIFNGTLVQQGNTTMSVSGNTISFPKGAVGQWQVRINIEAVSTFSACNFTSALVYTNCTAQFITTTSNPIRTVIAGTAPTLNRMFYEFGVSIVEPSVVASIAVPVGTLTGAAIATNVSVLRIE